MLSVRGGLGWGLLGVAAFSFKVPFTRIAVGGLSPLFIGSGRAVVAALLAVIVLSATRQHRPTRIQWARLAIVAGGVVIGLLPAATATMAVLRGKERPAKAFWIFAILGAIAAVAFASAQNGGFGQLQWSDLLLFGAVGTAGIGYAEGGLLARELGSWHTVSWALILAAPLMIVLLLLSLAEQTPRGTPVEWLSFSYLAVVSMFLGFFAWYRGLAVGPMTQVSQVQLV